MTCVEAVLANDGMPSLSEGAARKGNGNAGMARAEGAGIVERICCEGKR
jgi:hypothetical protein